jgi:branched-chain amino acid transport system substrate-binding protein
MRRVLCAFVLLVLPLAACGGGGQDQAADEQAEPSAEETAAGAQESSDEPIIIGAPVAQSGGFELYDNTQLAGMQWAIDRVNAEGGIDGRQVELLVVDNQTDPAQVESATREVLEQGADVIVTTPDYDFGAQAALAAAEAGVVSIGGAGAPEFGLEGLGPLHFNVFQGTQTEAAVMAEWAYNEQGWRNAYLLEDTSIEYSKALCELFEESWTQLGGTVAGRSTFLNSDPSIANQVTDVRGADADVVLVCSYPPGGASAIRQLRTGGVDLPLFGGAGFDGTFWLEAIPDLSDFYHPAMVSSAGDDPNEEVNTFLSEVDASGGTIYALFGYEIIETIRRGVEIAGTTEGEALAEAIESFSDEEFLVGPTSYSAECHIPVGRPMTILEIQGGDASYLDLVEPSAIPEAPC